MCPHSIRKSLIEGKVLGPQLMMSHRHCFVLAPVGNRSGTADIHAIYRGRHISIEIKISKDRQSERQKREAERIRKTGGP